MLEPVQDVNTATSPTRPKPAKGRGSVAKNRSRDPLERSLDALEREAGRWCTRIGRDMDRFLATVPDVGPACEVLLADRLLNDLDKAEREGLIAWIRSEQREDGAWCGADGRPDLSLTAMGWWARREAGDDPESQSMVAALRLVHELGGAQRASFIVRLWLAMGGLVPWSWLPAVPNELWLLPPTMALSTARISPWARGIITAYHLLAQAPARLHLSDASALLLRDERNDPIPPRLTRPGLAGDLLQTFDRSIKLARKLPRGSLERRAKRVALSRLDDARHQGGGWMSTRPTLYAVLALRAQGARSNDPRITDGLDALRKARGLVERGGQRHLAQGLTAQPCALLLPLQRAAGRFDPARILDMELCEPERRRPTGGWSIDGQSDGQFDLFATCVVVESLRESSEVDERRRDAALRRAATRIAACQDADGGFSRYELGETRVPLAKLPWRDADQLSVGTPDDENRVRLTAQALRSLELAEPPAGRTMVDRGLDWLDERFVRDGRNWSIETLAEVARCTALFCSPHHSLRRNTESSLRRRQREDGSFGSLVDTARALTALVELDGACVQSRRAAQSIIDALERDPDATDEAPQVTGIGLSPDLRDTCATIRECRLALLRFGDASRGA